MNNQYARDTNVDHKERKKGTYNAAQVNDKSKGGI